MAERRDRRHLPIEDVVVAALLAALAFALGATSLTWRLDRMLYDISLATWPLPVADDVVIVAIDDESVQAIGRFPWRRAVHAALLDRIATAAPKAIALDLLLSDADPDPQQDSILRAAIERAGPVIVPVSPVFVPQSDPIELVPTAALRDVLRLAQADVELDADGILRHGFLRAGLGRARLPHMALAMMEAAGEPLRSPIASERAPQSAADPSAWRRDQRFLIRFVGASGQVRRIAYVQLLRGDISPQVLAGKYVLIGLTASGLGDAWPTPVSSLGRQMPGTEIVAQVLHSLRSGATLRELSPATVGMLSALATLLLLVAVRMTGRGALALTLAAAVAAVAASLVAVRFGVWASPVAFVAAALLAYPLWSWRRLEHAVRELDREIERLAAEPDPFGADATRDRGAANGGDFVARRLRAVGEATLRLRRARQFLGDSLNALPVAALVTGADDRVLIANAHAADLFGAATSASLSGESVDKLLGQLVPVQAGNWRHLIDQAKANGATVAEQARLRDADSDRDRMLVHLARPPTLNPVGPGLVISIADVSALKRAEAQREEALAFVSHDLRSPAASILILAEAYLIGGLRAPVEELMGEFKRLAKRTLDISEAFVQLSRAESQPLELRRLELHDLVNEAIHDVAATAQAKRVVVELAPGDTAARIDGDAALLQRAIANLLSNAVKFSPPAAQVAVGLTLRDGFWIIAVRDRGPGIAPADRDRLFNKFQRVGDSGAESVGVGLGLAFVDQVARRHGGQVRLESTLGEGALFELLLPAPSSETT